MRALRMKHMRGEPCLAALALSVLCVWGRGPGKLVLFDLGDARGGAVSVASGTFEGFGGLFIAFGFGDCAFGFCFGVQVLESAGGFETDA